MSDSVRNEHPTAVEPSSSVMRQSVALPEEEHGSRLAIQSRTDRNASRQSSHGTACHPEEQLAQVSPRDAVRRQSESWPGMTVEIVQANRRGRIDYRYCAPRHMLVVYERGVRHAGCTVIESLSPSTLQDCSRNIVFVPAGYAYHDWHDPRTLSRVVFFYVNPMQLAMTPDLGSLSSSLAPRLFFKDNALVETALKIARLIESSRPDHRRYVEALGVVLVHELMRTTEGTQTAEANIHGGLAAWQRRKTVAYIEQHLAEPISLEVLAQMAGLSRNYFCRAFRQSFGIPPKRYQLSQRIERAKTLLAKHAASVTDIGGSVGYNDTSAFSTAFRRVTGLTPRAYRRNIR
ncbi:MAG TPA: AraC family transcriptional regulator [Steroidobacteraceae bacterium]|nr:AraC family transcriptional regulator [Steroidobacteraceae bacterium]